MSKEITTQAEVKNISIQESNQILTEIDLLKAKNSSFIELAEQAKNLKIKDVNDKEGYKAVQSHITKLTSARTTLKEDRLTITRKLDAEKDSIMEIEKELLAITSDAEATLNAEKKRIDDEKEAIRLKALEEARLKLAERMSKLRMFGSAMESFDVEILNDAQFEEELVKQQKIFADAELERLRIEEEQKAIREKEEADRKALEEGQRLLAEAQAKLDADKKAIEEEKTRIEKEKQYAIDAENRKQELEKFRQEAAEQAKTETEARIKREQEESNAKAKVEQEELEKKKKWQKFLADNGVTRDNYEEEFDVRTSDD